VSRIRKQAKLSNNIDSLVIRNDYVVNEEIMVEDAKDVRTPSNSNQITGKKKTHVKPKRMLHRENVKLFLD
jgi:hypothetical protein